MSVSRPSRPPRLRPEGARPAADRAPVERSAKIATKTSPGASSKGAGKRALASRPADDRIHLMLEGVRAAGLKLTPQRIAIVRALAADPSHPTAQEIFDRLQTSLPTMSFATVYNTLDALSTAGLCGSLSLSPGPARFDPNMAPHHHAVCDGCGLVRDVARSSGNSHSADLARPIIGLDAAPALSGFEVRAVEHIYRGLCAMCVAREQMGDVGPPRGVRGNAPRAVSLDEAASGPKPRRAAHA